MAYFILTMNGFGKVMKHLKGFGNNVLDVKKELVQGIILLAVAFAHAQKNESAIGIGMLKRSLEKLGTSPSTYHSIDVDRMRKKQLKCNKQTNLLCLRFN